MSQYLPSALGSMQVEARLEGRAGDGFIFPACEYVKHKTILSEGLSNISGGTEILCSANRAGAIEASWESQVEPATGVMYS